MDESRARHAAVERQLELRTRELANALDQQTAISEILRVISTSPTDVQPVLDVVAERAAHLCDAQVAGVFMADGAVIRPAASYSADAGPVHEVVGTAPLSRGGFTGRAIVDRKTMHVADIVPLLESEFPDSAPNQHRFGFRAALAVPLLHEGGAYGAIFLYRRDPGLFPADQVGLVETFARQASIAIESVRRFHETKEALERRPRSAISCA